MDHEAEMIESESSLVEYAKFAGVLLLIFALAWWLSRDQSLQSGLRNFMGVFFLVFASFKLLGYRMFVEMFAGYDLVARRLKLYSYLYPFIELVLALFYLFNLWPLARDVVTVIVMGIGSIGVAQEIRRRSGIHCACLGNIIKLPLSTTSLVEDVGMGLMALAILLWR